MKALHAKRAGASGFAASAAHLAQRTTASANKEQGKAPATLAELMEMAEGEGDGAGTPMVKLGDASAASPFTSKIPSISSTLDIIRQGRCTLVTTMQMNQILALNCLISSYSLSVLYLDGIKYGDRQMMARGMLMMVVMISLSNAKPLKSLSPVRPLPSILHPALVLSMAGQFIVHLVCMRFITTMVKAHPSYVPTVEVDYLALAEEQTVYSEVKVKFAPSLFNTVRLIPSPVSSLLR